MSWVRTIAPEDAQPPLAALYEAALDPRTGELDNLWRMHSLAPEGLAAHLALYRAAMRGTRALGYPLVGASPAPAGGDGGPGPHGYRPGFLTPAEVYLYPYLPTRTTWY